jgi:hypothetical protein
LALWVPGGGYPGESPITKRRAEKLTGYEIRQLSAGGIPVAAGAFRAGELVASAKNIAERLAMRDLVARV